MKLCPAQRVDLQTVIEWIPDKAACRQWAGPDVRFPLVLERLQADIGFSSENAFGLYQDNWMTAFGQLFLKETGFLHLARIIVDPGQRGRGYGKILCRKLIDAAQRQGNAKFSLNVYRENAAAVRLYAALGFREVDEKSNEVLCHMIRVE